jgi:glucosamine kinase
MAANALFLGVDGGASRCRARLRDQHGRILGEALGAAANIHVDGAAGMSSVRATIDEVMAVAALGPIDRAKIRLGIGLAGLHRATDEARLASEFPGFARVRLVNDAEIAFLGAHAGEDGGVVIAGTGSAGFARIGERRVIVGGRGFILGDDGSAARLGYDALRRAMLAFDGLEPESELTRELMARFGDEPMAVIDWARRADPGAFGTLAPTVLAAAARGDPAAIELAQGASAAIARLGLVLSRAGAERLAIVGGLAEALAPYLPDDAATLFSPALLDATDGAILLAGGHVPLERSVTR